MLDIKRLREISDRDRAAIEARGGDVEQALGHDARRRELLARVEQLKGKRNAVSREIGARKKAGEDTATEQASMRDLGKEIAAIDEDLRAVEAGQHDALLRIPNVPHASVPEGADEAANEMIKIEGEAPAFDFEPCGHVEIGERLGIFDFARATRMSGAGFPLYIGQGARLERALIQFMLDLHVREHGYTEVSPPFVCNSDAMTGTGQLPKMEEEMYRCALDDLYLIPTAEVPVTNLYREEIIEQPLPIYLTAYTPCFRREAGAAGKETRGLLRVHQFDKVEMVKFVEPETSYAELESLLENAEDVLQKLGLHYRVLNLCAGDISFAAAKCYDIEIWAPGQKAWLEVSSCSNFEDFQARRAGIRYRDANGKVQFVHTLNGSGVALARLVVALIETGQKADGSVALPEVLVPYMDGVDHLTLEG